MRASKLVLAFVPSPLRHETKHLTKAGYLAEIPHFCQTNTVLISHGRVIAVIIKTVHYISLKISEGKYMGRVKLSPVPCVVPKTTIFYKKIFSCKYKKNKEDKEVSQKELRELYRERLKREKQCYIAERTGINVSVLSQFKNGHIDLYQNLFDKLEAYLVHGKCQA